MSDGAVTELGGVVGRDAEAVSPEPVAAVRPLLTVVRGEPTAEQLAALTAVIAARASAGAASAESRPEPSLWAAPVLRSPMSPGVGAWSASGLRGR